ncbi:MAG: DEAD/DEAH box helicase [Ilumatobacteraceae bacterium]
MTSPNRSALIGHHDFALDEFQLAALEVLDAGESVLVAAPTGSGKTVVAEYAIAAARHHGKRAIYTAPLKALSNQKFSDLVAHHGKGEVGLLTGDNSINSAASILVMTTEVLRNMIYADSHALDNLGVVVLDEVHFLQDTYRGPVWEEVIIHLDPTVQLVCLSATVSNAEEVADWLTTVRGPTRAIVEELRPVELINHYVVGDKATDRIKMFDTLVGTKPNPEVERLELNAARQGNTAPRFADQRSARRPQRRSRLYSPSRIDVVSLLKDQDLLPAIFFIFSRNQCNEAAVACLKSGIRFTTTSERTEIAAIIDERLDMFSDEDLAVLDFSQYANQLESGIATHHAGMVPTFKEIVEACFVRGLVKVVFATETLAVGINMPARAVVIDKLTKFTGEHHQALKPSEYTQLTGRAGRRGLDSVGHALVLWSPFVSYVAVAELALSRSFKLTSAFRPTFNMAANLIQTTSHVEARHLLNLSFAQFQANREVVEVQARITRRSRERDRLRSQAESPYGDISEFRSRGTIWRRRSEIEASIAALQPGDVILMTKQGGDSRGVVLSTAQRNNGTRITVLDLNRSVSSLTERDFESVVETLTHVRLPLPYAPTNPGFLRESHVRLQNAKVGARSSGRHSRRSNTESHPVEDDPDLKHRLIAAVSADRIDRELEQLQRRVDHSVQSVSRRFDDVVMHMEEWGYVTDWSLTERGRTLSRLFHESDMLIAESVVNNLFEGLDAPSVAALASVFVYEHRSSDPAPKPQFPHPVLKARWRDIKQISNAMASAEEQRGIPLHRSPDPGFIETTFAWASGSDLVDILDNDELTAGDFVRTMKQLIDLLRQLGQVALTANGRQSAIEASESLFRGVVAASSAFGNTKS